MRFMNGCWCCETYGVPGCTAPEHNPSGERPDPRVLKVQYGNIRDRYLGRSIVRDKWVMEYDRYRDVFIFKRYTGEQYMMDTRQYTQLRSEVEIQDFLEREYRNSLRYMEPPIKVEMVWDGPSDWNWPVEEPKKDPKKELANKYVQTKREDTKNQESSTTAEEVSETITVRETIMV